MWKHPKILTFSIITDPSILYAEQVTLDIDGEDGSDFSPTNKVRLTNLIHKQSTLDRFFRQNPIILEIGESCVHHGQGSSWRDPILLCGAGLVLQSQSTE